MSDLIEIIRNINKNIKYNFSSTSIELYEHQFEDCIMLKSNTVLVTIYITSPIKCNTICSYTFNDNDNTVTETIKSLNHTDIDARINAHKHLSDNSKTFEVCHKIKKIIVVNEKHPFISYLKDRYNFHVSTGKNFLGRMVSKSQSVLSGVGTAYTCVFTRNANIYMPIELSMEQTTINRNNALYFYLLFLMFLKKRFFKVLNIEDMHVSEDLNAGAIIHFDNIIKVDNSVNLIQEYLSTHNVSDIHFVEFIFFLCDKLMIDCKDIKTSTIYHKDNINLIIIELFKNKKLSPKTLNTVTDLNNLTDQITNTQALSTDDYIKSALDTKNETVNNRPREFYSYNMFDDDSDEAYGGGRLIRHRRSTKKRTKRTKCNRRRKLSNRTKKRTIK
jgi:hypothetical protein